MDMMTATMNRSRPLDTVVQRESNGGTVSCVSHGGNYLASAVAADGAARTHTTPLDHWVRLSKSDVAEWRAFITEMTGDADAPMCEMCRFEYSRVAK